VKIEVPTVCYGRADACPDSRWRSYEEYLAEIMPDVRKDGIEIRFEPPSRCDEGWRHTLTALDVLMRLYADKVRVEGATIGDVDVLEILAPVYDQVFRNYDVLKARVGIPEGHVHVRTEVTCKDGRRIVLQEATVSNLLRAFVTVKTHPEVECVELERRECDAPGYARWQLIESRVHRRRRS